MLAYGVVAGVAQIGMRAPDVIIGSTVHPFAALSARVVSRLRRRPFVFEIRDLWPQTLIDMGAMPERSVGARALYGIERRLVKGADAVISLLPGVSEYFASRSLTPRRLAYIPNGTPIGNGPADPAPARFVRIVEGWRADGAIVFGYVGAHGKANGLDTVLEAMTRLRRQGHAGIKLVLVGDGPEKDRLRQASVAAGLEGAVEFMDPVAKRAMPSVLGLFDAGVFHLDPNPVFRFGISSNKLFDYLGGGLPVVFACSGGYDPVAQANAGITIPPRDAGAMADAMLQIAGLSKEKRASMGDRARVYVKDEHDLDTLALRLADLLREVAGAAPTRRAS